MEQHPGTVDEGYGLIKKGARAKEYELAMLWLTGCGLVHKVHRVNAPSLPLRTSMADHKREDWVLNLPLWAIGTIQEFMQFR